jgi:hypothetical protein
VCLKLYSVSTKKEKSPLVKQWTLCLNRLGKETTVHKSSLIWGTECDLMMAGGERRNCRISATTS